MDGGFFLILFLGNFLFGLMISVVDFRIL
ncbi:MAG: hypothetical protein JWP81_4985, partial [Ferruginibacter sp.]|nr:hypothetical protein [Ferruginibacter sp.]MCW3093916.1 hypothetical protein [Ferruginibacter sp.]